MTLVPWGLLAAGAAVLAAVFGAGIGVPRVRPAGARGLVIRWGHAAVWVLLAAMFGALSVESAGTALVAPLGLAALATYLTFLVVLVRAGRR